MSVAQSATSFGEPGLRGTYVVGEQARHAIELSVVIPTYNEKDNVAAIVANLEKVLGPDGWEVIFVDDASPDGTAEAVRGLGRLDRRVRLISRHNRRGLASAVVEGALAASAEIVAVMDGDLQHDEAVLPELYRRVAEGEADIASASRFLDDHAREGLSSDQRLQMSNTGIAMANRFFGLELTDPLTGFFVVRRDRLEKAVPHLSGLGFKILLDLVTSMDPPPRVSEVPFRFRQRATGESKLDRRVMYDFILFFMEKWIGRFAPIPGTWLSLALVSALGLLTHLAVVIPAVSVLEVPFVPAQLLATAASMFATFSANNLISHRDSTLRGSRFWIGFAVFTLLCAIGIAANVGVAALVKSDFPQLVYVIPAMAGAMISVLWNFAASKAFARWKKRPPARLAASMWPPRRAVAEHCNGNSLVARRLETAPPPASSEIPADRRDRLCNRRRPVPVALQRDRHRRPGRALDLGSDVGAVQLHRERPSQLQDV